MRVLVAHHQPTTHIAFDEATAILAGDALQALAFSILGEVDARTDSMRVKQLRLLGEAVGFQGMALGQAIDLESEGKALSLDALKAMHAKKNWGFNYGKCFDGGCLR